MRQRRELERLAADAHQAGQRWCDFHQEHGPAIRAAEPYDRAGYWALCRDLQHILLVGPDGAPAGDWEADDRPTDFPPDPIRRHRPMSTLFSPATRRQLKARVALCGPSGSGKSYTALRFAFGLAGESGRVACIDTEHRSLSKYAGEAPDGIPWQFDTVELDEFSPDTYTRCIRAADQAGYDVLVIDSLSHAWEGVGGALDLVDRKGGNKFTAWKDVTPLHRGLIEAILASRCHVIVTMRSKMEYVLEEDSKGKQVPRKVGMAPVQRAGVEYEFDVVADLDWTHTLSVSKSRCPALDSQRAVKPNGDFIEPLRTWLGEGTPAPPATPEPRPATRPEQTAPQQATDQAERPEPSGSTPGTSRNDPATAAQIRAIEELAAFCGVSDADMGRALDARGVQFLADLSVQQGDQMIANLTRKKRSLAPAGR